MFFKLLFINLLTFLRIIGTIIIIPIYKAYGGIAAGIISLICYATDSIDGILARKLHASTFFGALFDGLADKMLTIANFILLYLITPYAIIPIIFELLVIIVQYYKFLKNLNIKSNIIGKSKLWILAISVVIMFFISDIDKISFISNSFKESILSANQSNLYFYLLLPTIIIEALTLISYVLEIFFPQNIKILYEKTKEVEIPIVEGKNKWDNIKNIWFNPEYYQKHKNDSNLRKLTKVVKEKN